MKVGFQTIADALRVSKGTVEKRANRENWTFNLQPVRGGQQKIFDTNLLPLEVRLTVSQWLKVTAKPLGERFLLEDIAAEIGVLVTEVNELKARLKNINSKLPKNTVGKLSATDLKRLGIKS